MQKWQRDIEDLLAYNPVVSRWLIHDFVWQEKAQEKPLPPLPVWLSKLEDVLSDDQFNTRIEELRAFARGAEPPDWLTDLVRAITDDLETKVEALKQFLSGAEEPPVWLRAMAGVFAMHMDRVNNSSMTHGLPPGWTFVERQGG